MILISKTENIKLRNNFLKQYICISSEPAEKVRQYFVLTKYCFAGTEYQMSSNSGQNVDFFKQLFFALYLLNILLRSVDYLSIKINCILILIINIAEGKTMRTQTLIMR